MPENRQYGELPTSNNIISTVLGFDFGEKRIGVAVGQLITQAASPLVTLTNINNKPDWDKIQQLINEWKPQALVVGIPTHTDGTETEMTIRADKFGRRLYGRFGLPVFTISEILSSYEAEERLKERKKINRQNKDEIDKMAAALITESWLHQYSSDPQK